MKIDAIDILLVEDNPGDARLIQEILKEGGLTGKKFSIAEDLTTALAYIQGHTFDIILLDLNLPDATGLETFERIIAAVGIMTPVIVITGLDDEAVGIAAIGAGAKDYLLKGAIDTAQLGRSIRYAIKRREIELSLNQERDRAQGYLDTVNTIIMALDREGRITTMNKKGCRLLGYSEEELIGQLWFSLCLTQPNGMAEVYPYFLKLIGGESVPEYFENPIVIRSGELRQIAWHNALLRDEQGRITGILSAGDDISERKLVENALKASEKRYHELFQSNPHPMWLYDLETLRFLEVNEAAIRHYNYSRAEFMAMTIKDIRPAEDVPRLLETLADIDQEINKAGIWRHLKKDGSIIEVEISSHTLLYDDRPAKMILVNDITEQLRIQAMSERLLAAIEQASETILITDAEGVILYANPVLEHTSGFNRQDIVGKKTSIFKSSMQDRAFYDDLWNTITSGSVWRGRLVNRRKDGTLYTEAVTISPVRDVAGTIVNYVAVKRDITKQLLLESQLQQAQKMESVGRLAGGVAHDFNNMLSVILGYAQMALEKTELDDPRHEYILEILDAGMRSANITRQLLAFARKQTIAPQVIDLNETVESMLKMLRRLIGEDINVTWRPGAVWPVKIDPSQLDQLMANICVNARDAIIGVGKITIETETISLDEAYCSERIGFIPGEFVLLSISDDGCGMSKETLAQLFEPFFTTKEMGKGTGLGLATVYGIIKQNNGFINVYSESGKGTTFRIYLPRHSEQGGKSEKQQLEVIQRGRGETVFIVEDELSILKLTAKILKDLGYAVITAGSPTEALSLAKERREAVDLLITDVVMPEMNGRDLANQLLTIYPNLKCLFMSGYTASVIASQGVLEEGVHFIQKPFSARGLAAKVREVLAA